MPSTQKYPSGLNKWEANDRPKREDFNSDNERIDALFTRVDNLPEIPDVPDWVTSQQTKPTATYFNAVTLAEGKAAAEQVSAVIVQVTGSRVLALTDAGKTIEVSSAGAATITIPADTTVNFPIGTEIEITQEGAGEVTVAAASGVTLRSAGDKVTIAEQYTAAVLKKRAANDWRMWGALK